MNVNWKNYCCHFVINWDVKLVSCTAFVENQEFCLEGFKFEGLLDIQVGAVK